jgi:hypothetical protein
MSTVAWLQVRTRHDMSWLVALLRWETGPVAPCCGCGTKGIEPTSRLRACHYCKGLGWVRDYR